MNIVAIIACHNRRSLTLRCLRALNAQEDLANSTEVRAVVVDDGSWDGTSEAIADEFPEVRLLRGDGGLYWAASMAAAEGEALALRPDYVLWLNDDVELGPQAVAKLLETALLRPTIGSNIVVGALRDPVSGGVSYSGLLRVGRHPLVYERVAASSGVVEVDTFNGNVVLVAADVAEALGGIDGSFSHAFADLDYGLRARRHGFDVVVAPGTVGFCGRCESDSPWRDRRLPVRVRWQAMLSPKGLPPRSLARFLARHGGREWPFYWAYPYLRLCAASVLCLIADGMKRAYNATRVPARDHVRGDIPGHDASRTDDAPRSDLHPAQDDCSGTDEDIIFKTNSVFCSRLGQAGVSPRQIIDDVEVRVCYEDVRTEQHASADFNGQGRADGGSAEPGVGADLNPRVPSERPQDHRSRDAERSSPRGRDEQRTSAERDKRAGGHFDDGGSDDSYAAADLHAIAAKPESAHRPRHPISQTVLQAHEHLRTGPRGFVSSSDSHLAADVRRVGAPKR